MRRVSFHSRELERLFISLKNDRELASEATNWAPLVARLAARSDWGQLGLPEAEAVTFAASCVASAIVQLRAFQMARSTAFVGGHWIYVAYSNADESNFVGRAFQMRPRDTSARPVLPSVLHQPVRQAVQLDLNAGGTVTGMLREMGGPKLAPVYG
jgi:hypothetical protein